MNKYSLLDDKKWLYKKYIEEKKGTKEICKLVGAKTPNSVRQALIKFSIPVRTIGDGLRINAEDDGFLINKNIIDGCLLGDGYLQKWNKESNQSCPYFAKRNKYYDHIEFVAKKIFSDKWEKRIKINNEKFLGKNQTIFTLRSLSNCKLQLYYKRWYPKYNGYKKIVPKDIKITPELLLHWFLDDGSSYLRKRKGSYKKQIVIVFCSESFSKEDNEFLCFEMKKIFGLKATTRKNIRNNKEYWRIYIPQSQTDLFYSIIGPSPVASLAYKWK